jgi:citrate lyase subunit beta / citryl-CoA lyase
MSRALASTGLHLSPAVARSWLLVPADRDVDVAVAEASVADAIILDLEDGVSAQNRAAARQVVTRRLHSARLPNSTPVVALIESAASLDNARDIARSGPTLRFIRQRRLLPRHRHHPGRVIASRVERIAPPVDGPTIVRDDDALHSATAIAGAAGMTGKLCLHAGEAAVINTATR